MEGKMKIIDLATGWVEELRDAKDELFERLDQVITLLQQLNGKVYQLLEK